jgi:hypothetical protein
MADKTDGITYKIRIGRPIEPALVVNTFSVNPSIKGIPNEDMAEEITEKLNSVIPGIVRDAGGQMTIEAAVKGDTKNLKLSDVPVKLTNAELVEKKVVGPARAARKAKKIDAKVGA